MVSYHAEEKSQDNETDWEALNQVSQEGSFYHTLRWMRVLERSFGLKNRYFIVYKGKDPVALCPLFEQKLRGLKSLTPLPSTDFKHLIITEPSNHDLMRKILEKSIGMAMENRYAYIIFVYSNIIPINSIKEVGPIEKRKTVPFQTNGYLTLDLEKYNPTNIWNNIFNSKVGQKKYIKRFEKSGFKIRETKLEKDLDIFYKYYSQNLSHIGAKPFDRLHFKILFEEYDKELRMTLLEKEGETAGGIIACLDPERKVMILRYMALNREMANTYHSPYALYWEAINKASELGYKEICFGTNTKDINDKSFHIKTGFGCEYKDYFAELVSMNFLFNILYKISQKVP